MVNTCDRFSMLEEFIVDSLRLILVSVVGFIVALIVIPLSPILIIFWWIGDAIGNYRKNYAIDRLYCEKCDALMGRGSFELAKVENTKRQNKWSTKVAEAEQRRKSYRKDPNATYAQKVYASAIVDYRSPYTTIDAICFVCKTKYIYSNQNSSFKILVENQES
jgi:hypothetical protein